MKSRTLVTCTRPVMLALALAGAGAARAQAAAPVVQRVQLADAALATTGESRLLLQYLAGCALAPGTVLEVELDGRRYEWPGSVGLAPEWHRRGLNEEEERWVSACILARTNHFGVPVLLSMRGAFASDAPGLQAAPEEKRDYPQREATFFGNLFKPEPVAYVCGENDGAKRRLQLAAHQRVCALPLEPLAGQGSRFTACGFLYVGRCTPRNFTQGGVSHRQAVTVFLPAVPKATARP